MLTAAQSLSRARQAPKMIDGTDCATAVLYDATPDGEGGLTTAQRPRLVERWARDGYELTWEQESYDKRGNRTTLLVFRRRFKARDHHLNDA